MSNSSSPGSPLSKKTKNNLISGIQETPYPTKSPTAYGKEYLQKFNEYLQGKLSIKDIIDIKNILLTKKPIKKKNQTQIGRKQMLLNVFATPKAFMIRNQLNEPITKIKNTQENRTKKIIMDGNIFFAMKDKEDDLNAELESFVQTYNRQSEQRKIMTPLKLQNNPTTQNKKIIISTIDKEQIIPVQQALNQFQKIKEFIDQRVTHKKSLHQQENDTMSFKLLQNFKFIAEDYIEKIKNSDLFSSDTTKKFYEHNMPQVHSRLNQFSIINYKKKQNQENKTSSQNITPQVSKQIFKKLSDNYINQMSFKEVTQAPEVIVEEIQSRRLSLKLKTFQSIQERNQNEKLKNYLSMIDQTDYFREQQEKKFEFIQKISELYENDSQPQQTEPIKSVRVSQSSISKRKLDGMHQTHYTGMGKFSNSKNIINTMHQTATSNQTNQLPLQLNLVSVSNIKSPRSKNYNSSSGRRGLNYLRFNQVSPKLGSQNDLSDDNSLISETEANLDQLYSQSQFIQQKVLQKDEKLNKLMKYFVKIEDIKNRVLRTNLKKLDN